MGGRRERTGIYPPLEIGTKKQKFLENVKSAVQFWSVGLILAMTVYFPIWHSHCTRVRFTVLVTCSYELCYLLNPVLCLQRQVEKLGGELFYYWPLLRNNNMATNLRRCTSSHGGRRFAQCCHFWSFNIRSDVFREVLFHIAWNLWCFGNKSYID